MCGIVAVINKYTNGFTNQQLEAFESLLYIDGLRGLDSTGVIAVDNLGNFSTLKGAVPVTGFLGHKDWATIRPESFRQGSALIGHNRKATKGSIVDDNAHPFVINNEFALVHNGTMYGDHQKYAKVDVDSHAIAHLLHDKGIQRTIDEISAAYCFFWYDQRNSSVNVLRNNQRPMFWVETQDAYYYASEASFLDFAINRNNLKIISKEIKEQPEFTHSIFTLKDKSWDVSSVDYVVKAKSTTTTTYTKSYSPKWGEYLDEYSNPDREPYKFGRGIINPNSQHELDEWEKQLALSNKIYTPKGETHQWALKGMNTSHIIYGMLLDFTPVNYLDLTEGYFLYFTEASPESNDPYLYKFRITGKGLNRHDLQKLVDECVIYKLTTGTARKVLPLNTEFSCVVIACVSGKEVSANEELEKVNA